MVTKCVVLKCKAGSDRSSHPEVFCKKDVLRNFAKFTGKHLGQRRQAYNFIKKETLAQVFSCEFWEIFKKTFFHITPLVAACGMRAFIIVQENCNFPLPNQKTQPQQTFNLLFRSS